MEPVWLLQHHTAAIAILVAGIVIALVAFDLIDVTVAGMIGVSTLLLPEFWSATKSLPSLGKPAPLWRACSAGWLWRGPLVRRACSTG
jgi:hypothetical protein